jgi:hypothetical protein
MNHRQTLVPRLIHDRGVVVAMLFGFGHKTCATFMILAGAAAIWGIRSTADNNGRTAHRDESGCYDAMFHASRTSSSGTIDLVANFKERLRTRTGTAAEGFTEYKNTAPTPAMEACDRTRALWAHAQGDERTRFMNELVKCLSNFAAAHPTDSAAGR